MDPQAKERVRAPPLPAARGAPAEILALLRLLRLLRRSDDPPPPLPADLEWDRLVDAALGHRIVPWLCDRLERSVEIDAPSHARERLRALRKENTLRAFFLTRAAVELDGRMRAAGIDVIHLKGPALAHSLHGRVDARQVGDLDILVRPEGAEAARDLLERAGFRPWWGRAVELDARRRRSLLRSASELRYRDPDERFTVDLHWRLHADEGLELPHEDGIWERSEGVRLGDEAILRTLSDEDNLFFLALHGTKHAWARFSWALDMDALLARLDHAPERWRSRLELARQFGLTRPLLLGLLVAHGLLAPPHAELACSEPRRDPVLRRMLRACYRGIARGPAGEGLHGIEKLRYELLLRRSPRYKANVLRRIVTPAYASDWADVPLPRALSPLYVVIRPCRLAWRHLRPARASARRESAPPPDTKTS